MINFVEFIKANELVDEVLSRDVTFVKDDAVLILSG